MTSAVVLDASAIVEALFDPSRHTWIRELVASREHAIVVPHVCDLEVVSALRAVTRRGGRVQAVLRVYSALPLERVGDLPMLSRVFALRDDFSAYDAAYVALAEALGAPLFTSDTRLARAVGEHTGVEVVEV